ncbi:hypothetical protein GC167_06015 [bacterium]|nr:hypothetical protein [bacterium]
MADVSNPTDTKSPRGFPNYGTNPTLPFPTPAQYDALSGGGTAPGAVPSASVTAGVNATLAAGAAAFIRSVRVNVKNLVIDLGSADFNGIQIIELARPVVWLGGNFNLNVAAAGGSAMDTAGVEVGVGTVVAAADPIATTQQNIVLLKNITLAAKLGNATNASAALTNPISAASGGDVFLNVSSTEATTGYSVTLNGFVELFYVDLAAA